LNLRKRKDFKVGYERLAHNLKNHPETKGSDTLQKNFKNIEKYPNLGVL
jgi:hypothetical protein